MPPTILVENLNHSFGSHKVIDDLSISVAAGEVFSLLGPNGAGKTTAIRLLNGLYRPSSGSIRVLGMDPTREGSAVRQACGVLTETPALYERLSARQNLTFFGVLAGLSDQQIRTNSAYLLDFLGLADRSDDLVGKFSKGMKQRLALARALLAEPRILYLDEPTSGLDPESAHQVRELIAELSQQEGRTIFMCTHQLSEAERLSDCVAVMRSGRILAQGSLAELNLRFQPHLRVEITLQQPLSVPLEGLSIPGLVSMQTENDTFAAELLKEDAIPDLVNALVSRGARILRVQPIKASLEDIYFRLQNESAEVEA